jgi:hypothetical protein
MSFNISKSYNASAVQVLIGGVRMQGFGPDDMISLEPDGELATSQQGADGEVTISRHPMPPHKGKITFMETSTSNALMMALLVIQRSVEAGSVLPFALTDPSTNETVMAAELAFSTLPAITKGKEAGTREWGFILPYPVYVPATA